MANRYATDAIEPISAVRKPKEVIESIPLPFTPPILTHALDILKPSTQISTTPLFSERPKLAPPDPAVSRTLSEFRYLKAMDEMKKHTTKTTDSMLERFNVYKAHIQKLNDEHIEKLKENAEKAASSYWWSMLTKAGTALLSALSLAFGLTLIATGGSAIAGAALIASGVLSLANFACSEANVWNELAKNLAQEDEERRKKIGMMIPVTLSVLSAGLGLFGGIHSIAETSNFLMGNIAPLFMSSLAVFEGVTGIGHSISQGSTIRSQAELTSIRDALNIERILIQIASSWIENFMAELKGVNQKAGHLTGLITDANIKLVRA